MNFFLRTIAPLILLFAWGCATVLPPRPYRYSIEEKMSMDATDVLDQIPDGEENTPSPWEDQNDRAVALLARESFPEAEAILQKLILTRPPDALPYYNLAALYVEYRNWEWVRSVYKNLAANTDISNQELYSGADHLGQTGRHTERAIFLEELVHYKRNPYRAYLELARDGELFGYNDVSIFYSIQYLYANPRDRETHLRLGQLIPGGPVALAHLLLAWEMGEQSEETFYFITKRIATLDPTMESTRYLLNSLRNGPVKGKFENDPHILLLSSSSVSADPDRIMGHVLSGFPRISKVSLKKAYQDLSQSSAASLPEEDNQEDIWQTGIFRTRKPRVRSGKPLVHADVLNTALAFARKCPVEYRSLALVRLMGEMELEMDTRKDLQYLKRYLPENKPSRFMTPFFAEGVHTAIHHEEILDDWSRLMVDWYGVVHPENYGKDWIDRGIPGFE